jgi:hypothetical protein
MFPLLNNFQALAKAGSRTLLVLGSYPAEHPHALGAKFCASSAAQQEQ